MEPVPVLFREGAGRLGAEDSKSTVPHLASPRGPWGLHQGAGAGPGLPLGTWVLLNVGKREFPAAKAGLATDRGGWRGVSRAGFLAASSGNSPSQYGARSSTQFCPNPRPRLLSHYIKVREADLAMAVA